MRIDECKVGMEVMAQNMFGLTYFITEVNKTTVHLQHRTSEKRMVGGKWIDEVFDYKNIRPYTIRPV